MRRLIEAVAVRAHRAAPHERAWTLSTRHRERIRDSGSGRLELQIQAERAAPPGH
jgi:hypothetical protein